MQWPRPRDVAAALAIAFVAGSLLLLPPLDVLRGWSIDLLTALHWRVLGNRHEPASSPTVVIAIDEETYRTPPFKGSPTVIWTREIGGVLAAVLDGGGRVLGLDVVFPSSIEQSEIPFGEGTVGDRMRGFDRDFLRAIAQGAAPGKLVLGELQLGAEPIRPTAGQRIAVGQQTNIRPLNVFTDADDVVRRVPLLLRAEAGQVSSLALELAARALHDVPELTPEGGVRLAGYSVPSLVPNTVTLNFDGGGQDIPTYSLADLRACAQAGNAEFFQKNFSGKVVLIGAVLDSEDRKVTSKRFATARERAAGARCVLPAPEAGAFARRSIPGVYVQATAVNNLLRHEGLVETGRGRSAGIAALFACIPALAALVLAPIWAVLVFVFLIAIWAAVALAAFSNMLVLPLLGATLAGGLSTAGTTAFRVMISEKDKRFLRKSFGLYLAPALVERMLASNKPPALGGETRTITIFFSDLAGFSSFSESMAPAELVTLMNTYLSAMTEIIEEQGGFVDKYIGDAIVGVFGAPVELGDHAERAVRAALLCCERLAELNRSAPEFRNHALYQRIGLNSGEALVGNIGSRRRFNYTVIGDAVNLASRLEGANKYFGTTILASESTFSLCAAAFKWREIDWIRVKGRQQPLAVYEPLAESGQETALQTAQAEAYAEALAAWRKREFARAAELFANAADSDKPSALFMHRAKQLILAPADPDWQPINTLEGK